MNIKGMMRKYFLIMGLLSITGNVLHAQQTATDFFNISLKAFKYRDYSNVIFFANKAIELNPKYAGAYWNLAIAYDCLGEYRKSLDKYSSAMALYDNDADLSVLHKNRGMVYISICQFDSALYDFNTAIAMKPDNSFAIWNKGLAYDGKKMYDSAIANYTHALTFFAAGNDRNQLLILRGQDYKRMGKNAKSDSDFQDIVKQTTAPDYFTAQAKFLMGDTKGAENEISK